MESGYLTPRQEDESKEETKNYFSHWDTQKSEIQDYFLAEGVAFLTSLKKASTPEILS